jgi:hydrogenase nickel incorporation protein HypB
MQIDINKPILLENDSQAIANRELLDSHSVFMVNLLAGPGAGKTSTLLATIEQLKEKYSIAVIEGDISSKVDAEKIKEAGIPAVQINTGGLCHLEANMISKALNVLNLESLDLIFIENVGNLVCPTDFKLGENITVMILSVPEGHDKPLKYPQIFASSDAILLNKIDTHPVFDFNERRFREVITELNPKAPIFPISATNGSGIIAWVEWLEHKIHGMENF